MTYFGEFTCKQDLIDNFSIDAKEVNDETYVLLAAYSYECYEGSAFVLFIRDDKLYEVHGSHCSCYGLEETWEPEETTFEALEYRAEKGYLFYGQGEEVVARFRELVNIKDLLFENAV